MMKVMTDADVIHTYIRSKSFCRWMTGVEVKGRAGVSGISALVAKSLVVVVPVIVADCELLLSDRGRRLPICQRRLVGKQQKHDEATSNFFVFYLQRIILNNFEQGVNTEIGRGVHGFGGRGHIQQNVFFFFVDPVNYIPHGRPLNPNLKSTSAGRLTHRCFWSHWAKSRQWNQNSREWTARRSPRTNRVKSGPPRIGPVVGGRISPTTKP
uniref:Uncharacterized protein n=1 Tax=Romanomermis culicivorax TaxID=13658 RepID=A0A915KAC4_ROMCU